MLHEVFIAVDEEGTEAAAVTVVAMRATGMPAEPVPMVVDRPFLFVIHDVEHGTPLFVGRVVDPGGASCTGPDRSSNSPERPCIQLKAVP